MTIIYVDEQAAGITRRRFGKGFRFCFADGAPVTDPDEIERLRSIGLPPAYRDCWYCPDPNGHLQATGFDDRGRKQYRYHPLFRSQKEDEKFALCAQFGRILPKLRERVEQDLASRKLTFERTVAAIVRLLDAGLLRVGNDQYAKENDSYGATTLRADHAELRGQKVKLRYRGKSGKEWNRAITDKALARFVRQVQDLPGQKLFQFVDAQGDPHPVSSSDVNAYIHDVMGEAFSAKHFRTFGASVVAYEALVASQGTMKLREMTLVVSQALGNTPAIARKSYIHPALIALCQDGPAEGTDPWTLPRSTRWLTRTERGLIAYLDALNPTPPRQ
ncbi:DNA topoisomerase-1 [Sphingobium subterraneum]|uniref:DNA topoisomerase n=2 Tax=Sphingobium subterraneum TaxID=627688 RepID=A0A841J2F2_9SPHN|nr:DNA topoisomerase-1 [Sphingobium subterraneum]